jgi:RNA polymerase sigma-70 factor (ECF subfamily)
LDDKAANKLSAKPTHETLMMKFKTTLDQAAFAQLIRDYASVAKAVANQILYDRSLAEDAVQETFVRLIEKREQYSLSNRFSPWFHAILRNVCIDMIRKEQRDKKCSRQLISEIADNASFESQRDNLDLLNLLPRREKNVLELRVIHSMPFKEIATALEISEEAAKKRAQRGLRKLRQRLIRSERAKRQAV